MLRRSKIMGDPFSCTYLFALEFRQGLELGVTGCLSLLSRADSLALDYNDMVCSTSLGV